MASEAWGKHSTATGNMYGNVWHCCRASMALLAIYPESFQGFADGHATHWKYRPTLLRKYSNFSLSIWLLKEGPRYKYVLIWFSIFAFALRAGGSVWGKLKKSDTDVWGLSCKQDATQYLLYFPFSLCYVLSDFCWFLFLKSALLFFSKKFRDALLLKKR